MFEDLARNLTIPKALGMRTVLIVPNNFKPTFTEIWEQDGRFYDPLRPVIEPGGFASEDELRAARAATLAAIRDAVRRAHIFVFTLGLTECWEHRETGLQYALCPGTVPGARFADIPGAGHLPNFQAPDAFNAALAAFLAETAQDLTKETR